MIVKLLSEHHLEFLRLKGGCRGSSESTLVKMSNCWKSHAAARISCHLTTSLNVSFKQNSQEWGCLSHQCLVLTVYLYQPQIQHKHSQLCRNECFQSPEGDLV